MATAAIFVLVNWRGQCTVGWTFSEHARHGWPWTYVARWEPDAEPRRLDPWAVADRVTEFRLRAALADLAVAVALLAAVGLLGEAFWRWRRRFGRLHLSSRCVLAGCATFFALLNVPGNRHAWRHGCDHGWPWTYVERTECFSPAPPTAIWNPLADVSRFIPLAFAGDLLLAVMVTAVVTSFVEWRRRRSGPPQFTLRGLLATMLAIAAVLGWLHWKRTRREALARVADDLKPAGVDINFTAGGPDWLRDWVGDEAMNVFAGLGQPVIAVHDEAVETFQDAQLQRLRAFPALRGLGLSRAPRITDHGMEVLDDLPDVESLSLWGSPVTDATLRRIGNLSRLESLLLQGTKISDDGLAQLKNCRRLRYLWLDTNDISDRGLEHLAALLELRLLGLSNTKVRGAGLKHLGGLVNLEKLTLSGTPIDDGDLVHLASLPKLWLLQLNSTSVSDAGLARLAPCSELRILNLGATAVTDQGLPHLAKLKRLSHVSLHETSSISAAGMTNLRKLCPSLSIAGP